MLYNNAKLKGIQSVAVREFTEDMRLTRSRIRHTPRARRKTELSQGLRNASLRANDEYYNGHLARVDSYPSEEDAAVRNHWLMQHTYNLDREYEQKMSATIEMLASDIAEVGLDEEGFKYLSQAVQHSPVLKKQLKDALAEDRLKHPVDDSPLYTELEAIEPAEDTGVAKTRADISRRKDVNDAALTKPAYTPAYDRARELRARQERRDEVFAPLRPGSRRALSFDEPERLAIKAKPKATSSDDEAMF